MNFKELLKSCDFTQARLARKVGINRGTVWNWAMGRNIPTLFLGEKVAQVLGVDTKTVLTAIENSRK